MKGGYQATDARYIGLGFRGRAPIPVRARAILGDPLSLGFRGELLSLKGLGRECVNRSSENPGIAKIGLTPPPLPQSWHSGGFDDKSA